MVQIKVLLCEARRAEQKAAWHEERERAWQEMAERRDSLKALDLTGGLDPLAGFNAETHRRQKEKRLREARALRQKVRLLAAGQDSR